MRRAPRPILLLRGALLVAVAATAACTAPIGSPGTAAPGADGGTDPDGGAAVVPPGEDGGSAADAGPPLASAAPRAEICGNALDDDDNGLIDDGCDCAVGTERPCWLGPPDARGVGSCHDGIQRCDSSGAVASWGACAESVVPTREILDNGRDDDCDGTIDEPDGVCVNTANFESGADCGDGRDDDCDTLVDCDDPDCVGEAHCPAGCDATETLCYGGYDDDCDGALDCEDPDCSGDRSCATGPCPVGQTPVYRERDLGSSRGGSSIHPGDGGPVMPMACEPSPCAAGQVGVVRVGQPLVCVPPPPPCPSGTHPTYVASGVWRCDPPCDLIIHYGSIYGSLNVCAGRPGLSCSGGQVPTFVLETRAWECRPLCDNGLYDRIALDGATVCVPC